MVSLHDPSFLTIASRSDCEPLYMDSAGGLELAASNLYLEAPYVFLWLAVRSDFLSITKLALGRFGNFISVAADAESSNCFGSLGARFCYGCGRNLFAGDGSDLVVDRFGSARTSRCAA